jgi:putative chitinase
VARRLFNGNAFSENGWPYVDDAGCTWIVVPGTSPPVHLQLQTGPPCAVMGAWAADWNANIEPLRDADSAGFTEGNSVPTSNHPGGTAEDLNWESHPFQQRGSLNAAQMAVMAEMEDFYEGNMFWAGRWDNPVDEMHSQMGYDTYDQDNDRPQPKVLDFIARKIRPDGFSTFRRGGTVIPPAGPPAAQVLSDAMGGEVSLDRYGQLLPAVSASLAFCQCTTVDRIAMWCAQLGEESGGLQWMEELASGAEYEGRTDLGNTQPGDGERFKGRGPIQITGRSNYTRLSQWAAGQGLVPSPTFFVDDPAQLASDQYGFVGVDWYWTVARPMNSYADNGDILGATQAVNGGTNGLADRTDRWNRCRAMGAALLTLTSATPEQPGDDMAQVPQDQWDRVYRELTQLLTSRSPLRHLGEGPLDTLAGFVLNTDGSEHVEVCRLLAGYGHPPTLALLREVAAADPVQYPDRQGDRLIAQAILADVTSAPTPVATIAEAPAAPAQQQVVYLPAPAPVAQQTSNGQESTGQLIGNAYDALQKLRLADALPIEDRAPLAALISVLSTKNGAQL